MEENDESVSKELEFETVSPPRDDAAQDSASNRFSLPLPVLPEDALWSIIASACEPSKLQLESHQLVLAAKKEWNQYRTRLQHQQKELESRGETEVQTLQSDFEQVTSTLKALSEDVNKQIDDLLSQPVRRQSETSVAADLSFPLPSAAPLDDAAKLVGFWKLKQANVARTLELLEEERETIQHRISDLRGLQDADQYQAFKIIGDRRSEETNFREAANGYRLMLFEFANQNAKPGDKGDAPKDKLSAIERRIADRELDALKELISLAESRLRSAKQHLNALQRRTETLEFRVSDLQSKSADAPIASLDKTLEHALELRAKVSGLSTHQNDELATIASKNIQEEDLLRVQLDQLASDHAVAYSEMLAELRESRVKVIRAIHNSGGNVDAKFDLLRAHQHVAVVNRQIAAAESDRVNLKLELAQASGNATRALEFLRRTS